MWDWPFRLCVRVQGVFVTEDHLAIVMEYVDGGDMRCATAMSLPSLLLVCNVIRCTGCVSRVVRADTHAPLCLSCSQLIDELWQTQVRPTAPLHLPPIAALHVDLTLLLTLPHTQLFRECSLAVTT